MGKNQLTYQQLEKQVKELELQNSYLKTIFNSTQEIIFIITENFTVEYLNDFAAKYLNIKADKVKGLKTTELFPPEIAKKQNDNLSSVFKSGKPFQSVVQTKLGNNYYWLDTILTPIKTENGKIEKVLGISRDITDKIEVDKAFQDSEVKFKTFVENTTDAYQIISKGVFIECNQASLDIWDCTREDIIGHSPIEFSPEYQPDGRKSDEKAKEMIDAALSGNSQRFYWQHKTKDGKFVDEEVILIPIEYLGENAILAIGRDITELKKTERELRESENRFKTLSEITDEGIIIHEEGKIIDVNPSLLRLLKATEEGVKGKSIFNFVHPDYLEEVKQRIKEKFTGFYELKMINSEGEVFPVETTIKNVIINGTNRRVVSIREITERKAQEEILLKSEQELRIANATKDKFFSIIAHDLKGPIGNFLNISSYLSENYDRLNEEKLRLFLDQMQSLSLNTFDLLNNLLTWSRIQLKTIDLTAEKFNLKKLVDKSILMFSNDLERKKIKLTKEIDQSICTFANKESINMVIRNLLSNAIKFTPRKGAISVTAKVVKNLNNIVEVCIMDTGVGIQPDIIEKLFKIDTSFSTKGTEDEKGTGLGLILCKEFVEKNGGTIWLESKQSVGSKFYFTIPLSK